MRIKGTGKSEVLVGSTGSDIIEGGGGDDVLIGGVGSDYLTGGRGADTFVVTDRAQYDVITDFDASAGDRLQFDMAGYDGEQLYSGQLYDGLSFDTGAGTCYVSCVDINADGVMDTQLSIDGNNVFLLGVTPEELYGSTLFA